MTRFTRTAPTEHTAKERIDRFELTIAPGHTVTRVDHTTTLGAGRKGRSAEVSVYRTMECTCGARLSYGGDSIRADLAKLRHYGSAEERAAVEAEDARLKDSILTGRSV